MQATTERTIQEVAKEIAAECPDVERGVYEPLDDGDPALYAFFPRETAYDDLRIIEAALDAMGVKLLVSWSGIELEHGQVTLETSWWVVKFERFGDTMDPADMVRVVQVAWETARGVLGLRGQIPRAIELCDCGHDPCTGDDDDDQDDGDAGPPYSQSPFQQQLRREVEEIAAEVGEIPI